MRLSLLVICAVQAFQQDNRLASTDREKDVYAIYSLVLTSPNTSQGGDHNPRYLVARKTAPSIPQEPCVRPPDDRLAAFREVLVDYQTRKAIPRELTDKLGVPKAYALLNDQEVNEFIQERRYGAPGGKSDERFLGVRDLVTLTDVYFNQRGTLALTGITTWCSLSCASSQWKVFEKLDDGSWTERAWITCSTMA